MTSLRTPLPTVGDDLPYITGGDSSDECLDRGLNCSIDPRTGCCTECGRPEGMDDEIDSPGTWRVASPEGAKP